MNRQQQLKQLRDLCDYYLDIAVAENNSRLVNMAYSYHNIGLVWNRLFNFWDNGIIDWR